ncbi:nitroreductase family deazaflavin-dependent oxidoreductase [Mycobacterium sp. MMS18-G62]
MPIPKWVARTNKYGINQVTRLIAPWAPTFALVEHRGRKSGRTYSSPVMAFREGDELVFALTYGPDTDWVRNVIAAGGGGVRTHGGHYRMSAPRLYRDENASDMPPPVRFALRRILHVPEFLSVHLDDDPGDR